MSAARERSPTQYLLRHELATPEMCDRLSREPEQVLGPPMIALTALACVRGWTEDEL